MRWAKSETSPLGDSSIEECALRETLEEAGITVSNPTIIGFTNDIYNAGSHFVTFFLVADAVGEPRETEPEKIGQWQWFSWDSLPQPFMLPVRNLLKKGFDPFSFH